MFQVVIVIVIFIVSYCHRLLLLLPVKKHQLLIFSTKLQGLITCASCFIAAGNSLITICIG